MAQQTRLLAGTALALLLCAPAFAQDATDDTATDEMVPSEGAPMETAPVEETATDEAATDETADAAMSDVDAATVVATVNGVDITLGQMIIAKSQLPPQYQQLPDDVLFTGVLDQLIQQQLMADTIENVPARVEYAVENERRALLAGEAVNDLMTSAISDEAIQQRYDETFASAEPATEWNASHILVPTEEEAQAVLDRLEGGEAFSDLATELSQDPGSGQNGGNLGWFGPGMMVAPFEEAVTSLEPGETSEPIETQFGWHVVMLNETRDQQPPAFEEVSGEIAGQIQQEALQARLTELTDAAEIEMPEEGAFDPAVLSDLSLLDE
ncbi:peptidylprolyl isomerase [Wenxinia marina]|uniref:Parvulin-like PPIase n=1 Tax=Wenxinia marina DSM 24838 TaxID=1123501 RepID=A0A0D0QFB0_9RHOB|nr:peptidylprolyl isomerase [Wenxinia marina]KIQ71007.1 Parvulin-like peptidyl-prolyl isomerase [Wenxinia marina DSM 24838]GGL55596.1 peptidylprolyl isomerase [Wenxinia marina]